MLVENYSNSRSLQTSSAVEAIFSDLRVEQHRKDRQIASTYPPPLAHKVAYMGRFASPFDVQIAMKSLSLN